MGTNCGKDFPPPDTTNICTNDPIGQGDTRNRIIPHFCTLAGPAGNDKRREYCSRIGDNEWEFQSEAQRCTYDNCGEVKEVRPGCCDGCCGITGRGVRCKRIAYRGDPSICCFRDKAWRGKDGDPNDQLCFQTDARQRTCQPDNRDITNSTCQDVLLSYCSGADLDPTDTSWLNRWDPSKQPFVDGSPNCVYALNRNLFVDPDVANVLNPVQPNPSVFKDANGFAWSRSLLNQVFQKYADQGFVIGTLPGFPGYNQFQDDILQPICTSVPGICQQGLFATCSNSTTDQLVRNPAQVPWCGCYMPQAEYQRYVDEFQVNRECTPICARQGNIPLISANGIQPLLCNQSVCIIDDVTIALEATNVGGNINFAQFCSGCSAPISGVNQVAGGLAPLSSPSVSSNVTIDSLVTPLGQTTPVPVGRSSSSCLCIISNDTIAGASSQIEGINLSESCGESQCFKDNPNPGDGQPDRLEIPCDSPEDFNPFAERTRAQQEAAEQAAFRRWVIIGIVVLAVAVIILFMLYLAGIGSDTDKKIVTRKVPPARPSIDIKAKLANERHLLYGDQVGGSILDRGRFPLFPQPPSAADMKGSILNRNITPNSAGQAGCSSNQSILTREYGGVGCPTPNLSPGVTNGSILDRGY